MTDATTQQTGYGATRKTKKSAQREADNWNASGSGNVYDTGTYVEVIEAKVQPVEGGFACAYITTRTYYTPEA